MKICQMSQRCHLQTILIIGNYSSGNIFQDQMKQESIPVGCVLPAAVAIHGQVCLSACCDTQPPWVWAWRPPPQVRAWRPFHPGQTPQLPPGCGPVDPTVGVGLETLPQVRPLNFPPGCGPGDPCPPGDLQGMLGYYLQCMLGYHHPPLNRMTDVAHFSSK